MEEAHLRRISQIKDLPIFDLETSGHLGVVDSWKVNPTDQKLLAFCIKKGAWLTRPQFLATTDIVEYDDKMIVVRNQTCITPASEILELNKNKAACEIVGCRALTQSGQSLGRVTDFAFEVISSKIIQYVVGGRQGTLIIPSTQVVAIRRNKVIFSDNAAMGATIRTAEGMSPA